MDFIKEVENFSNKVLNYMVSQKVIPTPYNYLIYYKQLIEKENNKELRFLLEKTIQVSNEEEERIDKEIDRVRELSISIQHLKNILRIVTQLEKNNNVVSKKMTTKYNILHPHQKEIQILLLKYNKILESHNDKIRHFAKETVKIKENLASQNVFNISYRIYNEAKIEQEIEEERKNNELFLTKTSLLFIKVEEKDQILSNIEKKSLVKKLKEIKRGSDILGLFTKDVFVLVMLNTSLKEIKLAKKRIEEQISQVSIFVNGDLVELKLLFDIKQITKSTNIKELKSLLTTPSGFKKQPIIKKIHTQVLKT